MVTVACANTLRVQWAKCEPATAIILSISNHCCIHSNGAGKDSSNLWNLMSFCLRVPQISTIAILHISIFLCYRLTMISGTSAVCLESLLLKSSWAFLIAVSREDRRPFWWMFSKKLFQASISVVSRVSVYLKTKFLRTNEKLMSLIRKYTVQQWNCPSLLKGGVDSKVSLRGEESEVIGSLHRKLILPTTRCHTLFNKSLVTIVKQLTITWFTTW